jgi:hypothetical protein
MPQRVLIVGLVALAACGGGGGGSSGGSSVPFTTVSAIEPGQMVQTADSIGRIIGVETDRDGVIIGLSPQSLVDEDIEFRAGFDDATSIISVQVFPFVDLDARREKVDRTASAADPRYVSFVLEAAPRNADRATMADPAVVGLEYLLYGVWLEPFADIVDIGFLGGGAFGNVTPADAVPTAGAASYAGASIGYQVLTDGSVRALSSNVTLTTDFAKGEIGFTSDAPLDIDSGTSMPGLAVMGTLALAGSGFAGTGTAANGWSGPIDGRFFGPAAEEAGGAFDLAGPGVERYVGGFGARQ